MRRRERVRFVIFFLWKWRKEVNFKIFNTRIDFLNPNNHGYSFIFISEKKSHDTTNKNLVCQLYQKMKGTKSNVKWPSLWKQMELSNLECHLTRKVLLQTVLLDSTIALEVLPEVNSQLLFFWSSDYWCLEPSLSFKWGWTISDFDITKDAVTCKVNNLSLNNRRIVFLWSLRSQWNTSVISTLIITHITYLHKGNIIVAETDYCAQS